MSSPNWDPADRETPRPHMMSDAMVCLNKEAVMAAL